MAQHGTSRQASLRELVADAALGITKLAGMSRMAEMMTAQGAVIPDFDRRLAGATRTLWRLARSSLATRLYLRTLWLWAWLWACAAVAVPPAPQPSGLGSQAGCAELAGADPPARGRVRITPPVGPPCAARWVMPAAA